MAVTYGEYALIKTSKQQRVADLPTPLEDCLFNDICAAQYDSWDRVVIIVSAWWLLMAWLLFGTGACATIVMTQPTHTLIHRNTNFTFEGHCGHVTITLFDIIHYIGLLTLFLFQHFHYIWAHTDWNISCMAQFIPNSKKPLDSQLISRLDTIYISWYDIENIIHSWTSMVFLMVQCLLGKVHCDMHVGLQWLININTTMYAVVLCYKTRGID